MTACGAALGSGLRLGYTNNGDVSTLIRHPPRAPCSRAPPVSGLAPRVELSALWARLIPLVGGPLARPPGSAGAGRTAVPIAAVTTAADDDLSGAVIAVKEPLAVDWVVSLGHFRPTLQHPQPPAALRAG